MATRPLVLLATSLIGASFDRVTRRHEDRHRVNRMAQQRNFVLAFREARVRRHRLKVFLQLWWLNARNREISVSNFLFALALFPTTFERVVDRAIAKTEEGFEKRRLRESMSSSSSRRAPRPYLPEQLWRMSPDALRSVYSLLDMALHPKKHPYIKSDEWRSDMKHASAMLGAQLVVFQVSMALLESIIALIFADERGSANNKKSLLRLAKEIGVGEASPRLTNDELRVAIARRLLEEQARGE